MVGTVLILLLLLLVLVGLILDIGMEAVLYWMVVMLQTVVRVIMVIPSIFKVKIVLDGKPI
jgi:hypothetical protein